MRTTLLPAASACASRAGRPPSSPWTLRTKAGGTGNRSGSPHAQVAMGAWATLLVIALLAMPTSPAWSSDKDMYDKYWKEGDDQFAQGNWEKAAAAFTNAIRYYPALPGNYGSYVNRANAYSMLGKLNLALNDYNKVIDSFPDKATRELGEVFYNRGVAYQKNGKPESAIPDYERALSIDPDIKSVHNKMAWLMATSAIDKVRDGRKAVEHALIACAQTANKDWSYLDTLAAAYAEAGDFANALTTMNAAIELCDDAQAKGRLSERRALYEMKKPYRDKGK